MAIKNRHHRNHRCTLPKAQTGAVLLALMLVVIIGSSYFLVTKLNTNLALTQQSKQTGIALSTAKAALIGYAVAYPDKVNANEGPGYLPCPDRDNNGSTDPGSCSLNGNTSIGRFPYKTLEAKDLRDGHGERLWYVVSDNFRNNPKLIPLNSETAGDINGDMTVNGYADIAAIIFAADKPENSQDRTAANENDYTHYIEAAFTDSDDDEITDNIDTAVTDRYILLSKDELMKAVEKRVLGEVVQTLKTYRDNTDWNNKNIYPWMSEFEDPATSSFKGKVGTREGLLGIHRMNTSFDTTFKAKWDVNDGLITTSGSVSTGDLEKGNLTVDGKCIWLGDPAQADCSSISTFTDTCQDESGVSIEIERKHRFEFSNNDPQGKELKIERPKNNRIRRRKFDIHMNPFPARINIFNIAITDTALDGSKIGDECGKGVLALASGTTGGKFKLEKIHYDLGVPNEMPTWFVNNEWHHLIYVGISAQVIPNKGGSCVSKGNCLSLDGDNPSVNNEAIVVIAGAELDSINQDRAGVVSPPADITDYFELENNLENDIFVYWKNVQDFNDQVKVIPD